ncbi:MAG: hypothetical protein FDW93_05165 [Bergeyella sp.]|nr:hypothetical protein [Bergeyella sp.]
MARKKREKPKQQLTFLDVVKGNFLNREEIMVHYKYYLLLFVLMMMIIYSNHLVSEKIKKVNRLKEETEEYKSRYALSQSKLIKIKMESEIGKEVKKDSLLPLESHPRKLLIKKEDGIHGKTK